MTRCLPGGAVLGRGRDEVMLTKAMVGLQTMRGAMMSCRVAAWRVVTELSLAWHVC